MIAHICLEHMARDSANLLLWNSILGFCFPLASMINAGSTCVGQGQGAEGQRLCMPKNKYKKNWFGFFLFRSLFAYSTKICSEQWLVYYLNFYREELDCILRFWISLSYKLFPLKNYNLTLILRIKSTTQQMTSSAYLTSWPSISKNILTFGKLFL